MKSPSPSMLLALYCALAVLPLALIAIMGVVDTGAIRTAAVGTGAGALAVLLMQFLSSGRYEILSGRTGIDRTMRFHQLAARMVAALAVLHPLFLLMPQDIAGLRNLPEQAAYLFSAPSLFTGTAACVLLLMLVAMGVFRNRLPLRYEWWRGSHAVTALVAAAAALHHVLTVGAYSASRWLSVYWWVMGALAFGTLAYLYLIKPFVLARRAYQVVSNREIGNRIREIVLEPARAKPVRFQAGQFAWVLLDQPPVTLLDHPFSFSSAPAQLPDVRLLIKARGDFTGSLHEVRPGARAYMDGPHGNFTFEGRSGATVALVAGGIGIAPVMSLMRQLRADRDRRPVGILYGARNTRQLVHADEIRDAAQELDLRWKFFVDEPAPDWAGGVGELTLAAIRDTVRGDPKDCLCFLCGPVPMMLACRKHLLACGVPAGQIVFERFDYD